MRILSLSALLLASKLAITASTTGEQKIAADASAQRFQTALELLATDLEVIPPTLNRPSQEAVQKFVTDQQWGDRE